MTSACTDYRREISSSKMPVNRTHFAKWLGISWLAILAIGLFASSFGLWMQAKAMPGASIGFTFNQKVCLALAPLKLAAVCLLAFPLSKKVGEGEKREGSFPSNVKIQSFMPGKVTKLNVQEGDLISKGDLLCTIEAMKMAHMMRSPINGKVKKIYSFEGQMVSASSLLIELEPS